MPAPTVYKRKNSRWWWISRISVDADGTRRRVLLSGKKLGVDVVNHTREQALDVVAHHYGLTGNAAVTDQTPGAETLAWFTAETLRRVAHEGKSDGTAKEYRIALAHLSSTFGADTPFRELTRNAVGILQDALLLSGDCPVTVNKVCRHIRAALNRLIDDGLIERNPFQRFKALAEHHPEHRHLSLDDIGRFLAAAESSGNEPGFRIARMYLYTGLRRRELLELRRDAVDLDRRRIRVPNIKHHSRRERWIILPTPALDDLRWFLARSDSDCPLHVCQPDTLTHWIKGYLRAAGLPESLHLHSLRHTFVTHALLSGESPWKIKDHLDHSSITVTEGYAHTEPEEVHIRY